MNTRVICLLAAFSLFCGFHWSEASAQESRLAEADDVILTASTPQQTVLLWQPLVINLKIENNSLQRYMIWPQTDIPEGCVVFITPPNSSERFLCSSLNQYSMAIPPQMLEPGKSYNGRIFMETCMFGNVTPEINKEGHVPLNRTGHYMIELVWNLSLAPLTESREEKPSILKVAKTIVELDVVEPAGQNLEAFRLWKRINGGAAGREGTYQEDINTLLTKYGDTIYGQYLQYDTCRTQTVPTPANLPAPPEPGTPEYDFFTQPVAGYNAFLQKYPDFPLADKLMGEIAKFSSIEEIQSLLDTLKKKYPYSVEIPGVEALLAERIEAKRLREVEEAANAAGQE